MAPLAWCYLLLKLAVFDVDVFLLRTVTPEHLWLSDLRFFFFLGAALVLLLVLGTREFLLLAAFVLTYPLVLVFWKAPKRFWRQWPVVLAFLPAVGAAIRRFRSTFVLYSVAIFAVLLIVIAESPHVLIPAVLCLAPLLAVHLVRGVRKAYATSLMNQLCGVFRRLAVSIRGGGFVPWDEKAAAPHHAPDGDSAPPGGVAYGLHWLASLVSEKVRAATTRRHYDLYLLGSLSYSAVLAVVLFAFAHLGVHKAFPGSYTGAEGAGFWSFVGLSLCILTTSDLSRIVPASGAAAVASYAELACVFPIGVILVFSILTTAREAHRENLDEIAASIDEVAASLEARISQQWQLTVVQLEELLVALEPGVVYGLRDVRGLPPPAPPPSPTDVVLKKMSSIEIDQMGLLADIHFDFGRFDIREGDRAILAKNAEAVKKYDFLVVTVEGHSDSRGTVEYNLSLGERRARAAYDHLVALGVPMHRLKTVTYGKEVPLCREETEDCWQRNRRAHFAVTGKTAGA